MRSFRYIHLCSFISMILLLMSFAYSLDPSAYLIEEASESYFYNGTVKTPLDARGRLEVELPNTQDVLQYIRINLTANYDGKTNILSPQSFADVAASPEPGDRTMMSFDTDEGYTAYYTITNSSLIPLVNVTLTYANTLGGKDIIEGIENTFDFDIAVKSSVNINDVQMYITINYNSYTKDSIVLSSLQATSSKILKPLDMDVDGYYDRLRWVGDLKKNTPIHITFKGTVESGENYDADDQEDQINDGNSIELDYGAAYTFTGITIQNRFAKGPIREGVKMIFRDTVFVRGTITNKAHELRYSLTDWSVYNVTDLDNPLSTGTVAAPQELGPGEVFTTPWFEASNASEHYYVPEFTWQVKWAPSGYSRSYFKGMELPTLYQADAVSGKDITLLHNDTLRIMHVTDTLRNIGSSSVPLTYFQSVINVSANYSISDIHVFYSNTTLGGSVYEITSDSTLSLSSNRLTVTIPSITSILGKPLSQNEDIIVSLNATGNRSNDEFTFRSTSITSLRTLSGTPFSLLLSGEYFIPAIILPRPPGQYDPPGASPVSSGAPSTSTFVGIEKSSSAITGSVNSNTADVESIFRIVDYGEKGVGDIYAQILIPYGSNLETDTVVVSVYDNSRMRWIEYPRSKLIIKKDPQAEGEDILYKVWVKSETWDDEYMKLNLNDDDLYSITYSVSLPKGQNTITSRLVGFNYYDDKYISKDIDSYIAIDIDESLVSTLVINESDFRHQQIVVGKPVRWLKTIDVYNPNNASLSYIFRPMLFSDILSTHISFKTEIPHEILNGVPLRAQFTDTFDPDEYKTYLVDVTTPPVLIKDETYSVDESIDGKKLTFTTTLTLENPSSLNYEDIHLPYDIPVGNIISVSEGLIPLQYEAIDEDSVKIIIPSIKGKKTTLIMLEYTKTPPVLIARTDKPYYSAGDRVNISVIFIPAKDMGYTNIEIEVISDGDNPDTIYTEIVKVNDLKENIVHTISREFTIPESQTGTYFVSVQASLSPLGDITATTDFALESSAVSVARESLWPTIAAFGILVILYLVRRIYRQRKFTQELDTLKKEIEDLD